MGWLIFLVGTWVGFVLGVITFIILGAYDDYDRRTNR